MSLQMFNPCDWYWIVSGNKSQLFSSAKGIFVEPENVDYQQWLRKGNDAIQIKSEEALDNVLISYSLRPATASGAMKVLRTKRDAKLSATDWIVVKSYEAGEPVPQSWIDYRQALRDLPANTVDPFNPVWPQEP